MPPTDKKLEKLQKLLEIANEDYTTPEDLIKMSEAILNVVTSEKKRIDTEMSKHKGAVDSELKKSLTLLSEKEAGLQSLINKLHKEALNTTSEASKRLSDEIKRVERKIPSKTDLSGLEADIKALNDGLNSLPTEITMNNEAIRDGLELLQGDERLDKSAIKGLDELVEELKKGQMTNHVAGVRFLSYLADVNIAGITDGQTLVWDTTTGKFIPGTAGGGSGVPNGGTTGQVLTKLSNTDGDADWQDPAGGSSAWGGITGTLSDQTDLQNALNAKQDEAVVVSGSLTASLDQYYVNVASATYTDPSPTEGKGFIVFVRNGTATVGGTGYSTAGTVVYRIFHSGAWANYVYQVSSTFALAAHTHAISDVTGLQTALDGKAATSHTHTASQITDFSTAADARIAAAAGVSIASLSGGKIPTSQLPALALTDVFTVASEVAQLALTAEEGDVAIRTDLNKSYIHNGGVAGTMADWSELLTPTDTVLSVNGEVGAVTLTTDDISDSGQTNKWATAAEKTKLGHITVTQAVDLDTMESDIALKANDADVVHDTGNETIGGIKTFSSDPIVPDEVYGVSWNGSFEVPTKNALYDKIETLSGGGNSFNDIYIDQSGGTSDTYGVLSGTINGSNALFTVSQSVYATGTLKVWLNGQLMTQGSGEDFVETTPASGTFTFNTAPATGSLITVEYQKVVTNANTLAYAVGAEDIEITDSTKGIILTSPDSTRWRITVSNAGALTATSL